ncbi:MAG: DUF2147 domain-containing protein [Pseudomonadota bacterium]
MKRLMLAALFAGLGSAAFADDIVGTWQTIKDDNGNFGHIEIAPCGAAFCGTLVRSFDSNGAVFTSENQGRQIVWDMVAQGGGKYGAGKVYSPDRDQTYGGKMELSGNSLTVKGCLFGQTGCRSGGTWSRVN